MKQKRGILKFIWVVLFSIIKIPYYLIKGFYFILFKIIDLRKKKIRERDTNKNLKVNTKYEKFSVLKKEKGDIKNWEDYFYNSESQIGIILGARGSGKTAIGMRIIENMYTHSKKKFYAMGFRKEEIPSWIEITEDINKIKNNSIVLIDEGGILFNSRKSMTNANKILASLLLISRHKNISILFISQNSSNLDIDVIRQADFLILKNSSLLQKEFERKIIGKIYSSIEKYFDKYKDPKEVSYIYSDRFTGFIKNKLPSFWKQEISKSFR